MEGKLYFAYGSNLDLRQMDHRCPDAEIVSAVTLPDYVLLFRGFEGSGLATIEPEPGETVHGLLWRLTPQSEQSLDRYEGYPTLYEKRDVTVLDGEGQRHTVMAYVMADQRWMQPAIPSDYYYQGIRDGYRQNGLPLEALGEALRRVRQEVRLTWAAHERTATDSPGKLYFAYGSNINVRQMAERCPSAELVGNAVLHNYALVFRARNNGNGVASILPQKGRKVYGVLWKLTAECEESLDIYEGYPRLYEKREVTVRDEGGNACKVMTYAMTDGKTREPALPSDAYYKRIRDGYRQNALPEKSLDSALQRNRKETADRMAGMDTASGLGAVRRRNRQER